MNTVDMSRASRVPTVGRRAATMELNTPAEIVRAAGGLIVRRQSGQLEVALVHRPMHQDWSYPKGKLEEGETFEDAAQREVLEETGFICRLLRFVGHTDYMPTARDVRKSWPTGSCRPWRARLCPTRRSTSSGGPM
jgi:8-oxo-dGTP pyrophosphatase MutT (NUDIX family)